MTAAQNLVQNFLKAQNFEKIKRDVHPDAEYAQFWRKQDGDRRWTVMIVPQRTEEYQAKQVESLKGWLEANTAKPSGKQKFISLDGMTVLEIEPV
jgi:hypothetical protein